MAFNVIDIESGTLVKFQRKQGIATFPTPVRATAYAKRLGAKHGKKYKIKASVTDDSWIKREQQRQRDLYLRPTFSQSIFYETALGTYSEAMLRRYGEAYHRYIPLVGIAKHHFAHVSVGNKAMLAYTESPAKGALDIQTQIKPGSYLVKYFGAVLSPNVIEGLVQEWQRQYQECELKFARTPEEIVNVYRNGPNSCMSLPPEHYSTRIKGGDYLHPTAVYGQPNSDLTLAYIDSGKKKGGIRARALVWEEKKQYSRIYGDETLLCRELRALGYRGGNFDGAKVAKVKIPRSEDDIYLMPYIDAWNSVCDMGDHFLISDGGNKSTKGKRWVCCSNTNGITEMERVVTCHECDEEHPENRCSRRDERWYCRRCFNETYFYCERYGGYHALEGSARVVARHHRTSANESFWLEQMWCAGAIAADAFLCPIENVLFATALAVMDSDGRTISQRAYERNNPPSSPPASPLLTQPLSDWSFSTPSFTRYR